MRITPRAPWAEMQPSPSQDSIERSAQHASSKCDEKSSGLVFSIIDTACKMAYEQGRAHNCPGFVLRSSDDAAGTEIRLCFLPCRETSPPGDRFGQATDVPAQQRLGDGQRAAWFAPLESGRLRAEKKILKFPKTKPRGPLESTKPPEKEAKTKLNEPRWGDARVR
jgi:hypothetical protein